MKALSRKMLIFCRKQQLKAGDILPSKPFRFGFAMGLNPKEQQELNGAAAELVSLGYLEQHTPRFSDSIPLALTEAGFEYIYGPAFEEPGDNKATAMNVQNFNFHGTSHNIQIGDNNTQQIVSTIRLLVEEIDKSDVPAEAKAEAKGLLGKFLEHPVTSGLLAGVGVEAVKKMLGM